MSYSTDARIQMTEKVGYRPCPHDVAGVLKSGRQPTRDEQRGVAMLVVLTWLALMISLVSEFTYGTTVDAAQAANARDELRAHYLARSSVNLSRLLIKIQQRFIEPVDDPGAADAADSSMGGAGTTRGRAGGAAAWRRWRHQPAHHRLRRAADGVLQRLEGRGRRPRQPDRPQHHAASRGWASSRAASTRRSPPRTARSTSTAAAGRCRSRPEQADGRLPAAQRPDVLARASIACSRRPTPPASSSPARRSRARIIDWADGDDQMFSRRGRRRAPRTTATTRAPIATGPTTTATTPSRRSSMVRGVSDVVHGGVRASPDGLRVATRTAR